jgi:hypothetical protein
MSKEHRTEYTDDRLPAEHGTEPEDIREFVERRTKNPILVGNTIVWNFNNHEVNMEALEAQVDDFLYDEFVIPFQASGVWGYMVELLPEYVREAEILTYDQSKGQYNPYPSFSRHADAEKNDKLRGELEEFIEEEFL